MQPVYRKQFLDIYSEARETRKAAQAHAREQIEAGNLSLTLSVQESPAVPFKDWYAARKAARLQHERLAKRGARAPAEAAPA